MNRPSVLLVAYQCGPGRGSVSQIGWEWYSRLAQHAEVTLVTHVRNREPLEKAGAPFAGSDIRFVDTEWFAGPVYRTAKRIFPRSEHSVFFISSLDYFLFDFSAYRWLKSLRSPAKDQFDLIHRVTPVTAASPTWLSRLGIPLILGPLNSGLSDPKGFGQVMRTEFTWLLKLRGMTRILDWLIGSSRRAQRILVANSATRLQISPTYRDRCEMFTENGVDLSRFPVSPWPRNSIKEALKVLFVGRLVAVKGLDLLLKAVDSAIKSGTPIQLEVIGDGPLRQEWEQLARNLDISRFVNFSGARTQAEVSAAMDGCHVFCLPSVRESGGAVLLEAMAKGRPVIALNYGGPAEIVDHAVGSLLPVTSPAQVIHDLASTLQDVHDNSEAWRLRGIKGHQRAKNQHAWPARIQRALTLYSQVIQGKEPTCLNVQTL